MVGGWRLQPVHQHLFLVIVRRDQRRQQRNDNEEQDDAEAQHRRFVPAECLPCVAPGTGGLFSGSRFRIQVE
ncbi:hypothetical protein D3C71_2077390 [compost metagenome]